MPPIYRPAFVDDLSLPHLPAGNSDTIRLPVLKEQNVVKRQMFSVAAMACLVVVEVLATCGGGGGGGTGGMGGGASMGGNEIVYRVPWKLVNASDTLPAGGLVVYWFPASQNELQKSSLRESRTLTLYEKQCVTM